MSAVAPTPQVHRNVWLVCCALGLIAFAVFWRVQYYDFLTYDDPLYVTGNPNVLGGLTAAGIRGAFTDIVASNWQPVTVLSHALDTTLFGLNPRGHHFTSIFLHALNTVLLFLFLFSATRDTAKSALVAVFFAVHPLHVESVAWISSRKDVLSTFFMLMSLLAYLRFTRTREGWAYCLLLVLFSLGLMAKSMLVTLPFLLLVLDYWPLRRIDFSAPEWRAKAGPLVYEKIPLLALSLATAVIAVITQQKGGALQGLDAHPLYDRIANAIVSYALYAVRAVWPSPLAAFYPYPEPARPLWQIALSIAGLSAVTIITLRCWKTRPYLIAGWLWYIGTLVPVIGLVQIGAQAMADRYTYITIIGLFIMAAWWMGSFVQPRTAPLAKSAAAAVIAIYAAVAFIYSGYWRDSETLFTKTLEVTTNNFPAHVNLGLARTQIHDWPGAVAEFEAATRVKPNAVEGWYNLGSAYYNMGEFGKAAQAFAAAANISPADADIHVRMAATLAQLGRTDEAMQAIDHALSIYPQHAGALALRNVLKD